MKAVENFEEKSVKSPHTQLLKVSWRRWFSWGKHGILHPPNFNVEIQKMQARLTSFTNKRPEAEAHIISAFSDFDYWPSNTWRTFRSRTMGVYGFWRKATSACRMPWRTTASSV